MCFLWFLSVAGSIGPFPASSQPRYHSHWHFDSSRCFREESSCFHSTLPGCLPRPGTFWMSSAWGRSMCWFWARTMPPIRAESCKIKCRALQCRCQLIQNRHLNLSGKLWRYASITGYWKMSKWNWSTLNCNKLPVRFTFCTSFLHLLLFAHIHNFCYTALN